MANAKISQLPANTNPTAAGELPIVESGVTDKVTATDLITKAHGLTYPGVVVTNNSGVMVATNAGNAGEVLTSDGAGNFSFQAPGAGQIVYDAIVPDNYATVTDALAAASNGWNIFVRPGTYAEAGFSSSLTNITIVGAGKYSAVLDFTASNGNFDFSTSPQGWNLSNFRIDLGTGSFNASGYGCYFENLSLNQTGIIAGVQAFGIDTNNSYFNSIDFIHNPSGADTAYRVHITNGPNKFNNCKFDVSLDGLGAGADAIAIPNASEIEFDNCTFVTQGGTGLGCNVLFHNNGSYLTVNNCSFNNSGNTDDYAIYENNAVNAKITNNTFEGYGFAIYVQSGQGECTVDGNQINSTTTTGIGIDVDYGIGYVISNNSINLGAGGTSTAIRLWNGGSYHTVTANAVNSADTGIFVDTGENDVILSSNSLFAAGTDITDNGTGTIIINGAGGGGQTTYDAIVAPVGGNYTTLTAALAAASAGWRIYIAPGTYTETLNTTNTLAGLVIEGAGPDQTILNFDTNQPEFTGNKKVFQNFTVQVSTGFYQESGNSNFYQNVTFLGTGTPAVSHFALQGQNNVYDTIRYIGSDTGSSSALRGRLRGQYNRFTNCYFEFNCEGTSNGAILCDAAYSIIENAYFYAVRRENGTNWLFFDSYRGRLIDCLFETQGSGYDDRFVYCTQAGQIISNNSFTGNVAKAIYASNITSDEGGQISSNYFYIPRDNGKAVELYTTNWFVVNNNRIMSNNSNVIGIYVQNNSNNNTINSNNIRCNGSGASGIVIGGATDDDNMVCTNHLSTSTTPFTDNGTNTFTASSSNKV